MAAGSAGRTTTVSPATEIADFLGGFFAGEACFLGGPDNRRFRFQVGLGATDAETCEVARAFLGVGSLVRWPRRKEHYDDEVTFVVRRLHDLVAVVVPFMDEHLPPSHKREQYLVWREALLDYWEHDARFGLRRPR